MWLRFSDGARRAIQAADQEAKRVGSPIIDTEHLLLGAICDKDAMASLALRSMSVDLESLRGELPVAYPRNLRDGHGFTLSPAGVRVLDQSYKEARELGDRKVGTEHMLLALLRLEQGQAWSMLTRAGVTHDAALAALRNLANAMPSNSPEA